ncbi:hypothetical protein [Nocardioides sp.]|uniref:hypothetical protein n=1 Tax=Nocardioides sp. TaxID=35761 RepID=UPI003527A8F2
MSRSSATSRRALAAALLVGLTACSAAGSATDPAASDHTHDALDALMPHDHPSGTDAAEHTEPAWASDDHPIEAWKPKKLRAGERRLTLTMPASYTPSAPSGVGTDDYRCFLLDPQLAKDVFLTGTFVQPGNTEVVHHVILFRVPPEQVAKAEQLDAQTEGEGWTCFGNSGLETGPGLDNAPWLGAWAPGGKESVQAPGYGVKLEKGSQIVMQVHYNLLAGTGADTSRTLLRVAPASADLTPLQTMLLPAPVELPCRPAHADGPLCERAAAVADTKARFGAAGNTADLLHLVCGKEIRPGNVQTCTRTIGQPTTVRAVAGHMHLLGRSITIEVNKGRPDARTILDIPVWDFDDQGAKPIDPIQLHPFDTVTVTCRHVQWLRDRLPSFEGQPDKYVVWGEGTTDEMCLGILSVTRP